MKNNYTISKITVLSLKSVIHSAPAYFVLSIVVSLIHSLLWGMSIIAKQRLFDDAVQYTTGTEDFVSVLIAIGVMGIISVLSQILNGADVFMYSLISNKAKGRMSIGIHNKLQRIAPVNFENAKFIERLNVVEEGKNNSVEHALMVKDIVAFYLPYFIFMGAYLFQLKMELVIAIVIVFLPIAISQIIRIRCFEKIVDESASYKRKSEYFEKCIADLEFFKETRFLGIGKHFLQRWSDSFHKMQELQFKTTIRTKRIEFMLQMLTVAGYTIILISLFMSVLRAEISVGAFVAVFSVIASLYGIMKSVVCYRIGGASQNIGTIRYYLSFMDMGEEKIANEDIGEIETIELQHVSFTYPQKEIPSICDVNLTIRKGESIAFVGENGAGKSTLVKILSGLYSPTRGEMLINSQKIENISPFNIRNKFTAVFQKYQRYQMSVKNNIQISDVHSEYSEKRLFDAGQKAGADLHNAMYEKGINTILSRSFGTLDISGGEWQRLAIARCFYRDNPLVILDEPTAAIDPYEEKAIYERFASLVKEKTSVIVTHRLASARMADRIIVLDHGTICEEGTHDELMKQRGKYYQLYNMQQQWYS